MNVGFLFKGTLMFRFRVFMNFLYSDYKEHIYNMESNSKKSRQSRKNSRRSSKVRDSLRSSINLDSSIVNHHLIHYKGSKSKDKIKGEIKNKTLIKEIVIKKNKSKSKSKLKGNPKIEDIIDTSSKPSKQRSQSQVPQTKQTNSKIHESEYTPKEIKFEEKDKNSIIHQFRPNLTPRQIFLLGSFGGNYWRPIYSGVLKEHLKNQHEKYRNVNGANWWEGIPENWLSSQTVNLKINKYGVHSGTTLEDWESKNWIHAQDPYGWVQWYCEFYSGRRSDDDTRQIKRWLAFAGPKGRFKNRIVSMIRNANTTYDDVNISPVIRQGLQHWAYQLIPEDI